MHVKHWWQLNDHSELFNASETAASCWQESA